MFSGTVKTRARRIAVNVLFRARPVCACWDTPKAARVETWSNARGAAGPGSAPRVLSKGWSPPRGGTHVFKRELPFFGYDQKAWYPNGPTRLGCYLNGVFWVSKRNGPTRLGSYLNGVFRVSKRNGPTRPGCYLNGVFWVYKRNGPTRLGCYLNGVFP